MTIDTKGYLLNKEKNPFKIWRVIKQSLINDMMEISGADRQIDLWWNNDSGFTCPKAEIKDFSEMIEITFDYKHEQRRMAVFTDCDSDYEDDYNKPRKKIIISLGCWGSSVHLVDTVLRAMQKEFGGQAFIMENDSTDDWRNIKAS